MDKLSYSTLNVREQGAVCFVQMSRPEANNAINREMVAELGHVFAAVQRSELSVLVLEGLPEVFCFGADFAAISRAAGEGQDTALDPEPMYELFQQLAFGSFMTVAHVRGKANAGGVGFVAASDVVIGDDSAAFSLSELLFGLIPAMVLPFLIRRVGFQRAHYLAATTQTVDVKQAYEWGLVDAYAANSQALLRKQLVRWGRLPKRSIARYKAYVKELAPLAAGTKQLALATNREVFSQPDNVAAIRRYAERGLFPWEDSA